MPEPLGPLEKALAENVNLTERINSLLIDREAAIALLKTQRATINRQAAEYDQLRGRFEALQDAEQARAEQVHKAMTDLFKEAIDATA